MSVLVVGISHRSAPVALLERLALESYEAPKLIADVLGAEHIGEATVIATCNRLEVYAEVDRFHGSFETISRMLLERAGVGVEELLPHLYVHFDEAAVAHLFRVSAGLDSMVVGEAQILGQVRESLRIGQEQASVGPALNGLFQQALRVGKRAHAETAIDHAAPSLVTASLDLAAADLLDGLAGKRAVVLGAGSMASLAVAALKRAEIGALAVVNRTRQRAQHLADEYGAEVAGWDELPRLLGDADLVVSCTGAVGTVLDVETLRNARARVEGEVLRPTAIIDLALPHDVDPAVRELPGVSLRGLAELAEELRVAEVAPGIGDVREIVADEIVAFTTARRAASVTPTVVALRTMATTVVDAEMARLDTRLPHLDPQARAEVLHTVRRVADKLLHQPTVRVKQLANEEGAISYAAALAELFALDPEAVDAMTRADGAP